MKVEFGARTLTFSFPPSLHSQWLHLLQDGESGQPYRQRRSTTHSRRGEVLWYTRRALLQYIKGQRSA